jgi:CDP-diglyceride synthetase
MAEFVAVLLLWHFNASAWWWVAFVLVFILQVAHEMNKIYNKKQYEKK